MNQVNHNEVSTAILSMDLGTDTKRVHATIARMGQPLVDTLGAFLTVEALAGMNQKAVMRAVQAVAFAVSDAGVTACELYLDKVTAAVIATIMQTADACITFASMRYLAGQGGMVDPKSVNGVSRARLQRFGLRGGTAKTIESKVSRSVGKRGFLQALGVTHKSDLHSFTLQPGARESGFVLGYAEALERMTDGTFALVVKDEQQ